MRGCGAWSALLASPTPAPGPAHLILGLVYADQEKQLSQEEVDAQVLVDGVAVRLQPPQEAECGDADGQTDQGDHDAHPGDDRQQQLVDAALVLGDSRGHSVPLALHTARLTLCSARCQLWARPWATNSIGTAPPSPSLLLPANLPAPTPLQAARSLPHALEGVWRDDKRDTNLLLQSALAEGGTMTRENQTCGLMPWARLVAPPCPRSWPFLALPMPHSMMPCKARPAGPPGAAQQSTGQLTISR